MTNEDEYKLVVENHLKDVFNRLTECGWDSSELYKLAREIQLMTYEIKNLAAAAERRERGKL